MSIGQSTFATDSCNGFRKIVPVANWRRRQPLDVMPYIALKRGLKLVRLLNPTVMATVATEKLRVKWCRLSSLQAVTTLWPKTR